MRVTVEVDDIHVPLTYEGPESIKLGARVRVPIRDREAIGIVVELGSDYYGPARSIIEVLEEETQGA